MSIKKAKQRVDKRGAAKRLPSDAAGPASQSPLRWMIVIFSAALSLRLLYLFQIQTIPLFYYLAGDGRTYDEWAQRIAAGDWLGSGVFYQAPLFPYFLSLLQITFGDNLCAIRMVQALLGSISCVLVFLSCEKLFSRAAAIVAGLLLAFYPPAIFFAGVIDKSVLDLLLLSLLVWLLLRAVSLPSWRQWLGAGALLGLLGLSRENALILALVVPLWVGICFSAHALRLSAA